MAKNKSFSIRQELVSRFANALANPSRVAIVEYLSKVGESYFKGIDQILPLTKATVSQHLKVLKNAGLINGESMPPRVKYTINRQNWDLAREILNNYMLMCLNNDNETSEKVDADIKALKSSFDQREE